MKNRKIGRRRCNGRLLLAVLFIAAAAVTWAECSVSKVLATYGEHAATTKAQAIFADVVQTLCEEDVSAAVSLQTDENGNVTSFQSNAALQNAIQARLAASLCEALEADDRVSFSVPLGTLFGDSLSSGRGPSIRCYVAIAGSPLVTLRDSFTDAGINQTYHTVTAEAEITLLITALGKNRQTTVLLSVPVSQTAVVGDVPSVYVNF